MNPDRVELKQNTENVISIPHSLEIPRDRKGRKRWAIVRKWTPDIRIAVIESEAGRIIEDGIEFTDNGLKKAHLSGFTFGVSKYYPGGFRGLQESLGKAPNQRPTGYWTDTQNIEQEARRLILTGNDLSQRGLANVHMLGLSAAIFKYYSGGIRALREKLGSQNLRVPRGYWENPENIETEARKVLQTEGQLTQGTLKRLRLSGLAYAVAGNYPGGMRTLKEKLGTPVQSRPNGYWQDPVNIEMEARRILELEGSLTQAVINKRDMSSLNGAISKHYPGGMRGLKDKLGVPKKYKQVGYWTPQRVEQEARKFYEEHGNLTQRLLAQGGRNDLMGAIALHYPGEMVQLKKNLGVSGRKPHGYWTEETVLQHAREFCGSHGVLSHERMKAEGASDLSTAILKYFPGKTKRLQQLLGLELPLGPSAVVIDPEEANKQLRRLLEESI